MGQRGEQTGNDWRKKTIIGIVGACVVVSALYWWNSLRTPPKVVDSEVEQCEKSEELEGQEKRELSKTDVLAIMDKVIKSQAQLRTLMQKGAKLMLSNELVGVKKIYDFVEKELPEDPLKTHGVAVADFDALMNRWQNDPDVTRRTFMIMEGPAGLQDDGEAFNKAADLSIDNIIEIHEGILTRLKEGIEEIKTLQKTIEAASTEENAKKFDLRTATLVLQILVAASTMQTHNVSAETVEYAAQAHHNALMDRPRYQEIHHKIQELLDQYSSE